MSYIGRKGASAGLTSGDIPNDSITGDKIVAGTIETSDLADGAKINTNIALLAFKTAVNGSLAKYNLQDQVIDEYTNATGIDASASINETLASGAYSGGGEATITHDADEDGEDGSDSWYKWTDTGSTGSFSTSGAATADFLVVAGGGGGGRGTNAGGGGGGGGYRGSFASEASGGGASSESTLSLGAGTTYTITVGAGGTGATTTTSAGGNGNPSSISGSDITDITTVGGGGGGSHGEAGQTGGSGGGKSYYSGAGSGTANQGYAGGTAGNGWSGGGGGGAGGIGGTPGTSDWQAGAGGAGLNSDITGETEGYAGGGGGTHDSGDSGGGGTATHGGGAGTSGTASSGSNQTGGGGGGGRGINAGNGGSGIVVIRIPTSNIVIADLTLQSTDTEAETQPTKADMVMLMEDTAGTATINTDIKGFISRDSGTTFTQGTLVDEGDWGTNKRILAFHDLDISGQPADKTMCYKITTHNQSSGSKETKIHATSMGWR